MVIDWEAIQTSLQPIVAALEGPYKWHAMAGVAILLTALLTRFIFKTLKWFLLIVFILILLSGGLYALTQWTTL